MDDVLADGPAVFGDLKHLERRSRGLEGNGGNGPETVGMINM